MGLAYLKTGEPKNAFKELQRASSLDPTNMDAMLKTAEFLLLLKQFDDSKTAIDKILKAEPNHGCGVDNQENNDVGFHFHLHFLLFSPVDIQIAYFPPDSIFNPQGDKI